MRLAPLPVRRPAVRSLMLAVALASAAVAGPATAAETPATVDTTVAALGDLGVALLRDGHTANAVASPVALAAALGMVHAGAEGAAEREIEALFGPHQGGQRSFKLRLPALLKQVGATTAAAPGAPAPFVLAGRVWLDRSVASAVPTGYTQRLAQRYGADATRVNFADSEAVRGQINGWTAERTAGRINDLMPPGSVSSATLVTLTAAVHFRSPWEQPFDAARTEARSFQLAGGENKPVPTLVGERPVLQALVGGTQIYALPFAGAAHTLLLAVPAAGSSPQALLQSLKGGDLAGWQAALQPRRCEFTLPKFTLTPRPAALRPLLEALGVKTIFTAAADLRPMLGRQARNTHVGEVFHAAGIRIDEQGGEAVAAAAATVQSKSLALPAPACAVDRPFVFAVVHRASGAPLFMGRVGDPSQAD